MTKANLSPNASLQVWDSVLEELEEYGETMLRRSDIAWLRPAFIALNREYQVNLQKSGISSSASGELK